MAIMDKGLSKAEFKKMYMTYRTDGDGWSDNYWDHFYENQKGKRYYFDPPETPAHTRMFISESGDKVSLFFMSEEAEERFFDYPGKE